jgi:hypothetical protein
MADGGGNVLRPDELAALLDRLDEVMAEAARLRREVTRQLEENRGRDRPEVSVNRRATVTAIRRKKKVSRR